MDKKVSYVQEVQKALTALAVVNDKVVTLDKAFFDRGYNVGGSNEITDPDIYPNTQVNASDLSLAITLLEQFKAFCSGQAVTPGDYASTLNKIRSDF